MNCRIYTAITLFALAACTGKPRTQIPIYLDQTRTMSERVEDALQRMTLEEKIAVIHAQSKFSSAGVPRLGIPEAWATDGPHGIRAEVKWDEWDQAGWSNDSCTAYPALTCLAATWNRDMALRYGRSIGEEARYRNKNILLGPGVNIYRTPLCGRNFEYMGEDPYLASQMVVPYVKGVQQNGVAACVKHFALNNQEGNRHISDVEVDDRALYEIYLPAFKAAVVQGDAWAIMGAYGLYKGQHCCHNKYLLEDILRKEWGFKGVVVSDWGGTHNTEEAIYNGLDMEFGTWTDGLTMGQTNGYDSYYLARPYYNLIKSGAVGIKELDDKVRRVLRLQFLTVMRTDRPFGSIATPEHAEDARMIAQEGIVLLKNNNSLLPVDLHRVRRVLVVGENAVKMMTVGGGSSSLKAKREISPLDGIRQRFAKDGVQVEWVRGYVGDTITVYNGVRTGQSLHEMRSPRALVSEAVARAAEADYVIFVGGLNKSPHQDDEGVDRLQYSLPYGQNELIEALAAANPRMAVALVSGNAVQMPWIGKVGAVVQAWYGGSEAGPALAAVLCGDVNPSGKLPFTFPVELSDNCAFANGSYTTGGAVRYPEGIFVGYRWTEHENIRPLFAFGHGLSYTRFAYENVRLSRKKMSDGGTTRLTVTVRNIGQRSGAEVVQLYIGDNDSSVARPVKELKGFEKVMLAAGEQTEVGFDITTDMLQYFDAEHHKWCVESGVFTAYVGSASDDIRGKAEFTLE